MLTIPKTYVTDILKSGLNPAATCNSGDTAAFETRDCYDDNDITEENPLGSKTDNLENPATGPLFIRGAEPGDVLKVEILSIQLRDYGIMRTSTTAGAFPYLYSERTARRFWFEKNRDTGKEGFWFDNHLWVDCNTMIGVIGTAPKGEGIPTITPGTHGGNMDCNKITAGTTLYLPVNVPGALLAIGDLHARMGDGEIMICGLETAGTVTVRVTVLKPEQCKTAALLQEALPLLLTGDQLITIQSAPTLDEASLLAARRMQRLMAGLTDLDDVNSGMLMSLSGNLSVCQIVNPLLTVRCEFPVSILKQYCFTPDPDFP